MIYTIGSINIDHVYRVSHMPSPGETLAVKSYERYLGGKGANQSIAIARSGSAVTHIGALGVDGDWAKDQLTGFGLKHLNILEAECASGHAMISVDDQGENQILIYGGANHALTMEFIAKALENAKSGEWLILQNEVNLTAKIADLAKTKAMKICYSAAPFIKEDALQMLDKIDLLAVNEGEAAALSEAAGQDIRTLDLPYLLITKGKKGAELHIESNEVISQNAFEVEAVDTTGAGDTFIGAFMAQFVAHQNPKKALQFASAASAIQVTRHGAASAIPLKEEVMDFMKV